MKVVCNTSPLIFLSKLKELELLSECFGEIHIPQAVKSEIGDLALPTSVNVSAISEFGKHYVAGALGVLHTGELEAIRLAEEIRADWVILDDLRARQKALRQGLSVIGTIGVLQLAQAKGLFSKETFTTHLDALVNQHGMWLSAKMLQKLKG
ncbi:MAG: DUF3368 domain-containing protein [Thiolinea sp.]